MTIVKENYVESDTPLSEHTHKGWFYYYPTKSYYRWNDIPYGEVVEEDEE